MEELLTRVGDRIRKARLALGLTQEALAEKADMHVSYIGQIERGLREPSLRALYKVCAALDLELHDLFTPDGSGDIDVAEFELIVRLVPDAKRETFLKAVRRVAELSR